MKDVGIVQGSESMAKPVVVGSTTVYVHDNIQKVETDVEGNPVDDLYQYHEVQYTTQEYIEMQATEVGSLSDTLDDLMTNVIPGMMGGTE